MNVIVVGAKLDGVCNDQDARLWNNEMQAKHSDLVMMMQIFNCEIKCYDLGYPDRIEVDGVDYINDIWHLDGTGLSSDKLNVVVEFTNMLDENYINRGEDNPQYHNLMKLKECGRKVIILACGCSWNDGFPVECMMYLSDGRFHTPLDAYDIDNLLFAAFCSNYIRSLTEKERKVLCPYQLGIYQVMGTFMWRGCEADGYKSEGVLRELFDLIGSDGVVDNGADKDDLDAFIEGRKHWNELKWSLRKELSKFVYGIS